MGEYRFVEPKTRTSIRKIYIDEDMIAKLKLRKEAKKKVLPNCKLVLNYNGTLTSKTTPPRPLEKLAKLADVHHIKVHALRHPYVKHTTKNTSLQKQKSQTINDNLIVWGFCFHFILITIILANQKSS